jgi:GAF domain-containing protein
MARVGASSATFYLKDPWWFEEYRLVLMEGVRYREPMYGFLRPHDATQLLEEGEVLESWDIPRSGPVEEDERRPPFFGGFRRREGVEKTVRLQHRADGRVVAVLFVNLKSSAELTEEQKRACRKMFRELVHLLPDMRDMLLEQDRPSTHTLFRVLQAAGDLSRTRLGSADGWSDSPYAPDTEFLHRLTECVMAAFGLTEESSLCSVHEFDPRRRELRPLLLRGRDPEPNERWRLDGTSILSWVAERKRALLIDDLPGSAFNEVYCRRGSETKPSMRSLVCVPMLAGDELLGVMNLEDAQPGRFNRQVPRLLWYVGDQAATALQQRRHHDDVRALRGFVDAVADAYPGQRGETARNSGILDQLADSLREIMRADSCQLWTFDGNAFVKKGSARMTGEDDEKPRAKGWSEYAVRNAQCVWIERPPEGGHVAYTKGIGDPEWSLPQEGDGHPQEMNPAVAGKPVLSDLGLPLVDDERVMGVVWLKHESRQDRPAAGSLNAALKLSSIIAKLMTPLLSAEAMRWEVGQLRDVFLRRDESPGLLDSYVHAAFYEDAPLGGDWCLCLASDDASRRSRPERKLALFLGDGEGHGYPGALQMIPICATFLSMYRQTDSVKYVFESLHRAALSSNVRAEALFAFIEPNIDPRARRAAPSDTRAVMFGSGMGDAKLYIVRGDKTIIFPPEEAWSPKLGFDESIKAPMLEAYEYLREGDVLVFTTDGVAEAKPRFSDGTKGSMFGTESIIRVVKENRHRSAREIAEATVRAVERHSGAPLASNDDSLIFVAKVLAAGETLPN